MSTEYELFKGKSLSSLFEDIYNNSKHNKHQLEVLVKEVTSFIKDGDMAVQLIPMIKEYLEINVKNDEQLVKLATIVQRMATAGNKGDDDDNFMLSDREKEQLMSNIQNTVNELQDEPINSFRHYYSYFQRWRKVLKSSEFYSKCNRAALEIQKKFERSL